MTKNGIDISKHNGKIDFTKVKKAGVDFVIIRAGFGKEATQKDPLFDENYVGATKAGLPVGAYWYSYAKTPEEAKKEAQVCYDVVKGKKFEYPIFFDIEEKVAFASKKADTICKAFCDFMEEKGFFAGIYISRSPAQSYLSMETRNRYAMWLAEYNKKLNYNGSYGMWQYSSTGVVEGVKGSVDRDYAYVDYPAIIKAKGLNGFKKTAEKKAAPAKKPKHGEGQLITLLHKNLYRDAYTKTYNKQISGSFYVYDGEEVNKRYRITTRRQYCGKLPASEYVTGFVELDS